MIKENNGWYCTDNDCMQYCRNFGDRVYEFIQVIWLDTCKRDTRAVNAKDESDNYIVATDTIDMNYFTDEDIELAICSYYGSIEAMEKSYGMNIRELDAVVAECYFENISEITDFCTGAVSWNDAEKIIQDYINTGSLMEFGKDL